MTNTSVVYKNKTGKSLFESIHARRSVRMYTGQALPRGTINDLLDSAVRAPTAVHEEPWAFVIIQNKALLKKVSDYAKPLFMEEMRKYTTQENRHSFEHFASPEFDIFHNAGNLIIICAKINGPFVVADCWLAAENILLASCAMGLGSCVIGSAVNTLNLDEVKASLSIPADYTAVAPIVVGTPKGDTPTTSRRPPNILAWKA